MCRAWLVCVIWIREYVLLLSACVGVCEWFVVVLLLLVLAVGGGACLLCLLWGLLWVVEGRQKERMKERKK